MSKARWIVAMGALLSYALSAAPAFAAGATPAPTASAAPTPEQFDRVDVVTLMAVVLEELKQYQGSILLETRPASAMPAWDPLVYYAGVGVSRQQPFRPVVWTVADTKSKGYEHALLRAYVMAVMDTGEAGPKFQRAYDVAAGADQALPGDAPDPYRYRHAAAEPFVKQLTQTNV
ncbi:MAG TPA: hypothetical protein VGX02_04815 [Candidatus Eremiobacteraceae bacterium]|nr:hypothetical protein [Candidatus Eremiobacteraceae bacterium]